MGGSRWEKKSPSPSDNSIAKKCYFTVLLFGLGTNTTLGMTLIMRWVSESVLVGRCMAGTVEARVPEHRMFESGDRQE